MKTFIVTRKRPLVDDYNSLVVMANNEDDIVGLNFIQKWDEDIKIDKKLFDIEEVIPNERTQYQNLVTGLPEPKEGVAYLVSTLVLQAAPHRQDIYCPHDLSEGSSRQSYRLQEPENHKFLIYE